MDLGKANKTKGINPDAGLYNPTYQKTKTSSPDYRFGSQQRILFEDKVSKTIPAPGHYPLSNGALSKKGALMGKKLKSLSSLNVPGAGTYQPDYSPSKTQMPRFSMGMKLKPELNKLKVPGPG